MILTAVLMWKKHVLGYVFVLPWLVFSALMGLGIVAALIMNLRQGLQEAIPPLVMVGLIVMASSIVSYRFNRSIQGNG